MMKTHTAIRKWNYGNYSSANYGAHSLAVQVGNLTLYFSYDTVVGFNNQVCENAWGTTTGKHLNWLEPDKKRRIPYKQFQEELEALLKKYNLTI